MRPPPIIIALVGVSVAPLASRVDVNTFDLLTSSDPLQDVIDKITTKLLQAQAKAIDREWARITTGTR